jgi:branched-chain amino acid transport system substrate-binding protein
MRILFLLALALIGCGNTSNVVPAPVVASKTVKVGVIAPLDAGLVEFGRGIRNSVQLAVAQANNSGQFQDLLFEVDARDDSSTPAVGEAAARSLAADGSVVGVVGTYNSGVAAAVQPVLDAAGIVMISPGNTNPSLTLGPNPAVPVRPHLNYFRLVVPDSIQGSVLAQHAFTTLGIRQVALVSENKSVSLGLVDAFATRFTALGGTITIREVFADGTTDFTALIARVVASNPQLLVYGGEFATAAPFRQQSVAQGLTVPLMGSDGIKDAAYISGAGASSEGDFASSLGAPLANLPGGPAFLAAYQRAGFSEPPSDFGAYAFDAANLILAAVGRRRNLIADVQAANTQGVTGRLAFDAFGDTLNKVVTVYQVQGGVFVARATITVP